MIRPLIFALMLSSCGYVPASTVSRLSALSPLAADPAGIAVALDLPDGLRLVPGSAVLSLAAKRGDGARLDHSYELVERPDAGRSILAIAPQDIAALRNDQAVIAGWKATKGATGSLSVRAGFCTQNAGPAPDARVSVSLRTEPAGRFLPLVRDAPVSEIQRKNGLAETGPCD